MEMDGWADSKGSRSQWTIESESALLEIWRDKLVDLITSKRNTAILMEIAVEMEIQNMKYTVNEIRVKMSNMKSRARRERKEVEKTGMPSTWERYDEMEDILRRYESHGQHEQDDDKTNIKKENDWKKNRRKISQNDSDLHQNDSDDQSEFDDISQSGGEDVSTTNTSLVSMPKKTTCTKNPLADKNRSTKKIKLSQPSPIMEIDKNDDIDLFFLSMAKTVKKLKLHEQIKLKQNICNLVFDAELNSVQSDKPNANNILDLDSNS
ncbi:uncharacterized protein [Eurosta solidaginis]|uniref:uncharacterized protein isoform X2 n=1 Tax=Eurosta solidaginis TaxID=178769 RepID=UPI0035314642